MELTRHKIRELAFQTLFALNTNKQTNQEDFFIALTDGKYDEYPSYLKQLVTGVIDQQAEINELIEQHLSAGWSLGRLAKTDLIIIQLAIYEIKFVEDVPDKVAMNEAIELTKKFSDDRSRKFVNGILSNIVKELLK